MYVVINQNRDYIMKSTNNKSIVMAKHNALNHLLII